MSAPEWNNLSSGLLGAVIGSIAGFLGSVFLNWKAEGNNRKGAGRAVLAEVVMNREAFKQVVTPAVQAPPFSQTVIKDQLPLVGKLLGWEDLLTLLTPYISAAKLIAQLDRANEAELQAQKLIRAHGGSGSGTSEGLREETQRARQSANNAIPKVCHEFAAAAEVLRRKVLRRGELKGFSP